MWLARTLILLLAVAFVACFGPKEIDDPGQWVTDGDLRFRVARHGCGLGGTEGLFPRNVNRCELVLFMRNLGDETLTLNVTDQEFGSEELRTHPYGVTISRDPSAVTSSGPAPAPGEAPEVVELNGSDEAVVTFYFTLPAQAQPDSFVIDPGTGTSYRYEVEPIPGPGAR